MGFKSLWCLRALPVILFTWLMAGSIVNLCYAKEPVLSQQHIENLVVLIKANFGEGDFQQGSGFIISSQSKRLYLATANHVVTRGNKQPDSILVQFKYLPGEYFQAKYLQKPDGGLDLAVLSIDTGIYSIDTSVLEFKVLGNVDKVRRADGVFPVGHPAGRTWDVAPRSDIVWEVVGDAIYFESDHIDSGSSGGLLVNDNWEVLGMIIEDTPPKGKALSINTIFSKLVFSHYKVDMLPAYKKTPITNLKLRNIIPKNL